MELINALASPETQMNGNFQTLEWAQVYGRRAGVTTGLTWGYYGGMWGGITAVDGTLTLTNAAANYIVVEKATGAISVSTAATNWNDTAAYARVYKVTTAAGVVSAVEDHRAGEFGIILGVPGSAGPPGPAGAEGTAAIAVADTLPAGLTQGEQWYESDSAGFYMRYVNPDATETLISMYSAGGDFIGTAAKGIPNGVASLDATGKVPAAQLPGSSIPIACSDETTVLTAGTAKVTFRMPYAMTLTRIKASLTAASTSGIPTVDVNKNGVSVFSTLLTIDVNEKTSATAATPAVLATTALADDDEITIDIDVAGTGAKGLKVYLL